MSTATPSPAAAPPVPDRWRTRMLVAVAVLQTVVAGLFCLACFEEVRDYLADTNLREFARPFWILLMPVAVTLAHVGLAAGTIAALCLRRSVHRSRRILLLAFGLALALQVLPHLAPMSWSYDFPEDLREQGQAVLQKYAPFSALGGVIDLLPLVLSVTVGLSRAGLRQLRLHPGRPVGATMAFAASLQLGLLATVALAFVEPIVPDRCAAIGLSLLAAHYGGAATICFLLARNGDRRPRLLRTLLSVSACLVLLPGMAELLVGLWRTQVWDHYLIAWGEREGIVSTDELPRHLLLFACRSTITALAANDLLARSSDSAAA